MRDHDCRHEVQPRIARRSIISRASDNASSRRSREVGVHDSLIDLIAVDSALRSAVGDFFAVITPALSVVNPRLWERASGLLDERRPVLRDRGQGSAWPGDRRIE